MARPKRRNTNKVVKKEETEEYEVERIVSHRLVTSDNGKPLLEYYLKWKNFSAKDNTWEPSEAVSANVLLDDYWNLNGGKQKREEIMKQLAGESNKRKPELKENKKAKVAKKTKEENKDFYESESDIDFSENEIEDESFRSKISWKDVFKIQTVRPGDDNKTLYALIRWSDGKMAKYPTSFVAKKIPSKLIEYYEKRLLFEKTNTE